MARLSAAQRDRLPASSFAGPGRSYPVNDRAHAANAKARASQAVNAGRMSPAQASRIDAKANSVLHGSAMAALSKVGASSKVGTNRAKGPR